tara:strand:+ start:135 stop:878 length:744 start_codon:yes stop_codon:yes gene_type:complete
MGWNTSLIIVENKDNYSDENKLLRSLGFEHFELTEQTTFEKILNPEKNKIGIGHYNGNLIICDGYVLTNKSIGENKNLNLVDYEKSLVELFPKSEIITVSCVSSVNFHGYSLIQDGEKIRIKFIDSEMKQEYGNRFEEENEIYDTAYAKDGELFWIDENNEDETYTEDQLLEDFTFKIAKRRLKVQIDTVESDNLFENTVFNVFQLDATLKKPKKNKTQSQKVNWKKYVLLALLMILVKIIFRFIYK